MAGDDQRSDVSGSIRPSTDLRVRLQLVQRNRVLSVLNRGGRRGIRPQLARGSCARAGDLDREDGLSGGDALGSFRAAGIRDHAYEAELERLVFQLDACAGREGERAADS